MTKFTDFFEGGANQMRHCDPCPMPDALNGYEGMWPYSLVKHAIIESRFAEPGEVEELRSAYEARGDGAVFNAAQQCVRCAEGMCLLIDGRETGWRVGGNLRVRD